MQENNHKLENVAIRMVKAPPLYSDKPIRTTKDVVRVLGKEFEDYDREVVSVVNLRGDGSPINVNIVSMGTVNMSLVSPREVFKSAILSNAAHILLVHNHPSGNTQPSRLDMSLTQNIKQAAELMDIPLLDHVILGHKDEYFSFRENGMLESGRKGAGEKAADKKAGRVAEDIPDGGKTVKKSILGELGRRVGEIKADRKKDVARPTASHIRGMDR